MPLARDLVRPRLAGLTELSDETVIRFGTIEPHQVVKAALATADLYGRCSKPDDCPTRRCSRCRASHATRPGCPVVSPLGPATPATTRSTP